MRTTTSDFVSGNGARLVKLRLFRYGQAVPHKSLHFLVLVSNARFDHGVTHGSRRSLLFQPLSLKTKRRPDPAAEQQGPPGAWLPAGWSATVTRLRRPLGIRAPGLWLSAGLVFRLLRSMKPSTVTCCAMSESSRHSCRVDST